MNCWKSINLEHEFGSKRLRLLASVTTIFAFILLYLPIDLLINVPPQDDALVLFAALLLTQPLHVVLHYLPFRFAKQKAGVCIQWVHRFPVVQMKYPRQITKPLMVSSLWAPTFIGTPILFSLILLFPQYAHFISMAAALNIGLSTTDYAYLIAMSRAPKHSVIEKHNENYEVLIQKQSPM
ncbi:DUF3267 domain-containing protein [Bacillaceae bacterium SIJ1]|uniref:DUF3267 domain-containing protein n=1 Tax=Litoribacterium kuwaitense TaxID=1398745 RepID=UPI0013ECCC56|nr:DUF3267 domain-containing protein [Litoribacterium kuwaitense]NGP43904.1 DUF3267 domain-containing protein [Litoribacterium kuwaitense]